MRDLREVTLNELNASKVNLAVVLQPKLGVVFSPRDLHFSFLDNGLWILETGNIEMNLPPILNMAFESFQLRGFSFESRKGDNKGCLGFGLSIRYQHPNGGSNGNDLIDSKDSYRVAIYYNPETSKWSTS